MQPISGATRRALPQGNELTEEPHDAPGAEAEPAAMVAPELALAALRVHASGVMVADASAKVEAADVARKAGVERQSRAVTEAREAEESASAWANVADVAKVVAIVGSAAAAVATGGSSLVVTAALAGALLQGGAAIAKKAGADEKLCEGMEYTGMGVSLLAGGVSVGQAIGNAGSQAATQAGAQAAAQASVNAGGGVARGGGQMVTGGATVVEGGASIKKDRAAADGLDARAEAANAADLQEEARVDARAGLDEEKRGVQSAQRAMRWAADLRSDRDHARAAILAHMRG